MKCWQLSVWLKSTAISVKGEWKELAVDAETALLSPQGQWHIAQQRWSSGASVHWGCCLRIKSQRNMLNRKKGEADFIENEKWDLTHLWNVDTECIYDGEFSWLLNPTNLTPHLPVYSVFPLHLHSTCSQWYKNKRWREAAALISSLTYSLKAGAAQREKCFSSVSCLKMDSAVRGSCSGPLRTPSEGQWSSAPAGAET